MGKVISRKLLEAKRDKLTEQMQTCNYKIAEINKQIFKYDEIAAKFRFKEGAVAFHKKFGNVLVSELQVTADDVPKYDVVDRHGDGHIVEEKELLPHGPATEVLYNK